MNRLKTIKRKEVIADLVEGMSIGNAIRMTGVSKPTIIKLIRDLGQRAGHTTMSTYAH